MKCESIQPNLLDYSKGLLSRSESDQIKAHIEKCEECAAVLEEEAAFACTVAAIDDERPINDVWALVRVRTKPRRMSFSYIWNSISVPTRRFAAVGAALIAIVSFAFSVNQPSPEPVRTQQKAVVVASDEPMARQTDTMIDVMERM